jgi:hypothetical protein
VRHSFTSYIVAAARDQPSIQAWFEGARLSVVPYGPNRTWASAPEKTFF